MSKKENVHAGKAWGKDAVLRVLRNPIYAGYMPRGDELHEGEVGGRLRSEGDVVR